MLPPSGFVVVWSCGCSDAHDDPAALADHCPGHRRPRLTEPIRNERPGPTTPGHACRSTPCPDHRTATTEGDPA